LTEQATEQVWQGAEQLRPLLVPIDDVEEWPGNPRRGNEEMIARSLDEFGQQKPIVVQASSKRIVAGNHTRKGAKRNGWTHIAAVVEEMDDATAEDYLLADNKSTDDATYDDRQLYAMVQNAADRGTLDRTLYSGDELDDLLATVQGAKETEQEETSADYAPPDDRWQQTETGEHTRAGSTGAGKETRLLLNEEDHEKFGTYIRILRSEWGTAGLVETILRSLSESVERVRNEVPTEHEPAEHRHPEGDEPEEAPL
jgi:ParB/Sulfiredoxin domain